MANLIANDQADMVDKSDADADPIDALSADECERQYTSIVDRFADEADDIIHKQLPAKVVQLQKILRHAPEFNKELSEIASHVKLVYPNESENVEQEDLPAKKKRNLGNGIVTNVLEPSINGGVLQCNKAIVEPVEILKSQILDIIELLGTVKISIQLAIPRIEDGNNFGVSIQEETVSELSRAEDSCFSVLESMSTYFVSRAKVASKMLKYVHVMDYKMAVKELDEKMYTNLRLFCSDLRNNAALLHDLIIKNLEKIRQPRTSNHLAAMY